MRRPIRLMGRGLFALILLTLLFLFASASGIAQEFAKGRVTNVGGKPLEGVTILLKGKNISTTTTADGSFSIRAANGAVLTVSYVGFETQEYKLVSLAGINIVLQEKTNSMDNVIVIGYGTVSKDQFTDALLNEYAQEFIGEGHYRWDLLRHDRLISNAQALGITAAAKKHELFPIPAIQISRNPNLTQNEGY